MSLTPSREHYIKTIYRLSAGNHGVQITEIADQLEVSKASVCTAMRTLQEDHYIYRGGKRLVYLTEEGTKQARRLTGKYETIKCFLMEVLQIDGETAAADACAMEHVLSPETLRSIHDLINRQRETEPPAENGNLTRR
jgi:Mn-dependent DtxR family transcriptional regulator